MARDVVLRLVLKNYERALDVAGAVLDRTERALATAKGIAADAGRGESPPSSRPPPPRG